MRKKVKIIVGLLVVLTIVIAAGFMTKKWWAGADVDLIKQQESQKKFLDEQKSKQPFKYVSGEIIIKVKDNFSDKPMSSLSSLNVLNSKYQAKIENINENSEEEKTSDVLLKGIYKLKINQKSIDEPLAEYKKDSNIEFAEPNFLYYPSTGFLDKIQGKENPNDPYYQSSNSWGQETRDQWNLEKLDMGKTWALSKGNDITVAVVDTGIDPNHEDLKDKITRPYYDFVNMDINNYPGCRTVQGEDYTQPDREMSDYAGHGTHVAGIIAASTNNQKGIAGIGWNTKIMPVRTGFVLECPSWVDGKYHRMGFLEEVDTYKSIKYAADKGAKIINMSFGGEYSQLMDKAIRYAYSKNVLLIVAAGNNFYPIRDYSFPANSPYVLTVGASNVEDKRSSYSSYGSKLDVIAPGGDIKYFYPQNINQGVLSAKSSQAQFEADDPIVGNNYVPMMGTSMAAPHVAGLASLILSKNPSLTNEELRQIIRKGADDVNQSSLSGWDTEIGFGRINANKSLKISQTPPVALLNIPSKYQEIDIENNKTIKIKGLANSSKFDHYKIDYQKADVNTKNLSEKWNSQGVILIENGNKASTNINQDLGEIEKSFFEPGSYYFLRLTVFDKDGNKSYDFSQLNYHGAKYVYNYFLKHMITSWCKINPSDFSPTEVTTTSIDSVFLKDQGGKDRLISATVRPADFNDPCGSKTRYIAIMKYALQKRIDIQDPETRFYYPIDEDGNWPKIADTATGDIDNDGFEEFIVVVNYLTNKNELLKTKVFAFDPRTLERDFIPYEINGLFTEKMALGNFDGDDKKDIALTGYTKTQDSILNRQSVIWIQKSSGSNEIKNLPVTIASEKLKLNLAVGDLNKNGTDEVVVLASDGCSYITGCDNSFTNAEVISTNVGLNGNTIEISDFKLLEKLNLNKDSKFSSANLILANINNDNNLETIVTVANQAAIFDNQFNTLSGWPIQGDYHEFQRIALGKLDGSSNENIIFDTQSDMAGLIIYDSQGQKKGSNSFQTGGPSLLTTDINQDGKEEIITYYCQGYLGRLAAIDMYGNKKFDRIINEFDQSCGYPSGKIWLQNLDQNKNLETIVSGYLSYIFEENTITATWPMKRHDYCNSNNYNYKCE